MPRVHAVADGFGVYPVALCGLIAMCFSIPGVGLFAVFYRSVEGVLDLIAFSRVRDRAHLTSNQRCEADRSESSNYRLMPDCGVHWFLPSE